MAGTAAVISAVVGVVGTVAQIQGQRAQRKQAARRAQEAAAERRRAEQLQKRREDIAASRQRRRAAAEARRLRARGVNLAANRGAGGAIGAPGSTVPAIQGNIQSQLNFNNAFINRVTTLNQGIRGALSNAAQIENQPLTAGSGLMAFGSLAQSAGAFGFKNRKALGSAFGSSGGSSASTSAIWT